MRTARNRAFAELRTAVERGLGDRRRGGCIRRRARRLARHAASALEQLRARAAERSASPRSTARAPPPTAAARAASRAAPAAAELARA